MRAKSHRRQHMSGVQHVPNVPEHSSVSTGANIEEPAVEILDDISTAPAAGESEPQIETSGEPYPAVSEAMNEDEFKAKQEAEAKEREGRASKVKGPRKLNLNERKVIAWWLDKHIGENEPMAKVVSFDEMEKDLRDFFHPSLTDNVVARGVFNAVYDDETRQLTGAHLTEVGAELYFRGQRKSKANNGQVVEMKPRATKPAKEPVVRNSKYTDNCRLRIMVNGNPRRLDTQGYFSWMLYREGMTYQEYIKSEFNKGLIAENGSSFHGPRRDHWDWDLARGNIALCYANQPETLEDGSTNPDYWYINNYGRKIPEPIAQVETQQDVVEQTY